MEKLYPPQKKTQNDLSSVASFNFLVFLFFDTKALIEERRKKGTPTTEEDVENIAEGKVKPQVSLVPVKWKSALLMNPFHF